jgi:hypothetical protein
MELDHLHSRKGQVKWDQMTNDEQTVSIILDLAKINLPDWLAKGQNKEGRTIRAFDKKQASAFLSKQFQDLWLQKDVSFDIEIDATTLNIFAQDKNVGMPVRLSRRSTGFRWHVSFAWKFTHASNGQYKNCILLLEEPGIHLHYSAQRDLLRVFERLRGSNTILYTTHLASMVDLGYPERVRIVEAKDHHAVVRAGVVSSQRAPMAVIEMCLGNFTVAIPQPTLTMVKGPEGLRSFMLPGELTPKAARTQTLFGPIVSGPSGENAVLLDNLYVDFR